MKRILIIIIVLVFLMMMVTPVYASPPTEVSIVSIMKFSTASGTFTASGPAVEAGIICPTGMVYDMNIRGVGVQSQLFTNLFVHKHFVCDDGSGTFEFNLNVRIIYSQDYTESLWRIMGGTGDYQNLRGTGTIMAYPIDADTIEDNYSGMIHLD